MLPSSNRFCAAVPARTGRCFCTGPDGRIALGADWAALLRESWQVGRFAIQTRHGAARLIKITDLGELAVHPSGASAIVSDESGLLQFRFGAWGRAWGYLRPCECCGSPGRIEVANRHGGTFLQFSALPTADAYRWSEYLGALVAGGAPAEAAAPEGGAFVLPELVRPCVRLPFDCEGFGALLAAFGEKSLPLCFTLSSADVVHRRDLVPVGVTEQNGILAAGEPGARMQLAWAAVHYVALVQEPGGVELSLIGADEAVLLTLSAAAEPRAACAWQDALRAAYPGLA